MIYYFRNEESFSHFAFKLVDNDCSGTIIITDPKIFDSPEPFESAKSIKRLNGLGRFNVVLIERLSEIFDLLQDILSGKSEMIRPPCESTTQILGLYGFFSHFIGIGTGLETNHFMDVSKYTAQTLNHLSNLLYNVAYYNNVKIYIADLGNSHADSHPQSGDPLLWSLSLPNTHVADPNVDRKRIKSQEEQDESFEVPLGLVISKWVQEII